jgi:hypothetical protein
MERLASMHEEFPDLVITNKSNINYEGKSENAIFGKVIDISNLKPEDKLSELTKIFYSYEKVVLHIHPEDFVAAVAMRIVKQSGGTKFYFVNHADHIFSFGRSASDCVLEVSAFGEALGRARCPGLFSSFIGIPLPIKLESIKFNLNAAEKNTILTSGSFWKFKPKLGYSLPLFLNNVLKKEKNIKLNVLGVRPLKDYWWWSLKLKYPGRVSLKKSVPFEEYKKILKNHLFVLDSFPVTGGTAFPEAIINGQLSIGISSPASGYTPADRLRISDPEEIISILENPLAYEKKIIDVLKSMEKVHGFFNVKKRYLSALAGKTTNNLLLPDFHGDPHFFEKCAGDFGKLKFPYPAGGHGAKELNVEMFIFCKSAKYFSLIDFIKINLRITRIALLWLKNLNRGTAES